MRWWTAQQLKSGSTDTRRQAVEKLAFDRSNDSVALLVSALDDKEPAVRKSAVQALGRLRHKDAVSGLIKALTDSIGEVREAAVMALRKVGDKETIQALIPLLEDTASSVRWQAAKTLERFGWQPQNNRDRVLRDVALGDFQSAAHVGEAALDVLSTFLHDGSSTNRRNLVQALGQIGGDRVLQPLIGALADPDSSIRVAAIEALKEMRDSRAAQALTNCLQDADPSVRATAASALAAVGTGSAALVRGLQDGHWSVRKACVEALGRLQDSNHVSAIVKLLVDPDHDVREAACEALGRIRDARAITGLVGALTDSQTVVRQCAALALRGIELEWDRTPEARAALPQLQEALKDREYWVRQAAREAIARIESAEQLAFEQAGGDETLAAALDILSSLLKHRQRDLRQAAVEALGRYNNQQLASTIAANLNDSDAWVRTAARSALEQLGLSPQPDQLSAAA